MLTKRQHKTNDYAGLMVDRHPLMMMMMMIIVICVMIVMMTLNVCRVNRVNIEAKREKVY